MEGLVRLDNQAMQRQYEKDLGDWEEGMRDEEGEPEPPEYLPLRIFWRGRWRRRVHSGERSLHQWRMASRIQRMGGQPDAVAATAGDKVLPAGSVYLMRTHAEGLCVFAGPAGLPEGTIVTVYVGSLYAHSELGHGKVRGNEGNDHKISFHYRGLLLQPSMGGIDGRIIPDCPLFRLRYFMTNGQGSILNSRASGFNCRPEMEYKGCFYQHLSMGENVPERMRPYLDDHLCPANVPYNQRVSAPPPDPLPPSPPLPPPLSPPPSLAPTNLRQPPAARAREEREGRGGGRILFPPLLFSATLKRGRRGGGVRCGWCWWRTRTFPGGPN